MAVKYLNATKQSPKGLLTTFERFNQEAMFKTASIDPYLISHPLPADRISNLESTARKSPYFEAEGSAVPAGAARHDARQADRLLRSVGEVARRYPANDNSLPARYARAIAAYQGKRLMEAVGQVDGLLREQPDNPYFWELKGQILLEFGQANQAIAPLRRARRAGALVAGSSASCWGRRWSRPSSPATSPRPSASCPRRSSASRTGRRAGAIWRAPMASRTISAWPNTPPRRPSSPTATIAPPPPRPAAPWKSCRRARPVTSRRRTS